MSLNVVLQVGLLESLVLRLTTVLSLRELLRCSSPLSITNIKSLQEALKMYDFLLFSPNCKLSWAEALHHLFAMGGLTKDVFNLTFEIPFSLSNEEISNNSPYSLWWSGTRVVAKLTLCLGLVVRKGFTIRWVDAFQKGHLVRHHYCQHHDYQFYDLYHDHSFLQHRQQASCWAD